MTIPELGDLLAGLCSDTYHHQAPPGHPRRIVYSEYGAVALFGDCGTQLIRPKVQVDVWTQTENDDLFIAVIDALAAAGEPAAVQDWSYDPEEHAMRGILQLVLA